MPKVGFNVAIKLSILLSHIFICTCPFCFVVTWCPYETSMCLSVSSNEPGIKSETCGVIWNVDPESKIQLVNCKLSLKSLLERSSLSDMRAIFAYIFWSLSFLSLLHYFCDAQFPLSLKRTCFCRSSLSLGGFGNFAMTWSTDPHLNIYHPCVPYVFYTIQRPHELFPFPFWSFWNIFLQNGWPLHKKCTFSGQDMLYHYFYHNRSCCQY